MATEADEHRRRRLLELVAAIGGTQTAIAANAGIDASYLSRLLYPPGKAGRKNLGIDTMSNLQTAYRLPPGWFDMPPGSALPSPHFGVEQEVFTYMSRPWPFKSVAPAQWELLSQDERQLVEAGILLCVKNREPPTKQHQPAPQSAAAAA